MYWENNPHSKLMRFMKEMEWFLVNGFKIHRQEREKIYKYSKFLSSTYNKGFKLIRVMVISGFLQEQ